MMKINSILRLALMGGLMAGGVLEAAEEYEAGFGWNRQTDWRKPPKNVAHRTTNGNPGRDPAGRPVWAYETVSGGAGLKAESGGPPWFEQTAARMYWNDYLLDGAWEAEPGQPPRVTKECLRHHFRKDRYDMTPVVRWINPCKQPITLAIEGALHLKASWPKTAHIQRNVDVVVAVVQAAPPKGVQVLFARTEPLGSNEDEVVLNVGVTNRVAVGDQIILSHRVTNPYGSDHFVDLVDRLTIRLISQ